MGFSLGVLFHLFSSDVFTSTNNIYIHYAGNIVHRGSIAVSEMLLLYEFHVYFLTRILFYPQTLPDTVMYTHHHLYLNCLELCSFLDMYRTHK
jgi:hypothetical protein